MCVENVIHRLTLDLTGPDTIPRVEVQQDNARTLVISLTQGGRPYWIAEGVTAVFSGRKPDGKPLFNACTIEKNRVRYDFTDQTTNVAGIVECEILLYSGDERILASPRFELAIDELIHTDGDVPDSAPEISALTQMVAAGTAMIEDLRAALGELENVEEILTQARAAAQSAASSEEAAGQAAGTAQSASSQAQASAQRAFSSAEGAAESLEKAVAAGELTQQLQQQAEAARDSAGESAAQASGYAETASASAEQAGAALQQIGTVVGSSIESHNVGRYAHSDIREGLQALADRVNAALDSDDVTLDQLSEIVAYIKSNKTLIDAITTSKVSVADIIDNLTTNVANKPLSAAQGVVLAGRIEAVRQITDEIERELADKLPNANGGFVAQAEEPEDKSLLWVDTDDETDESDAFATKEYVDQSVSGLVPDTRTINGFSLKSNITLNAKHVKALPEDTKIPSIEGLATEEYVNDAIGDATKENVFELIERLETTEEITSFTRDKEPDGTPYDFKRLYFAVINAKAEKTIGGSIMINDKSCVYSPHIIHTNNVLTQVVAEVRNGALRAEGRSISNSSGSTAGYANMYDTGFMALNEVNVGKLTAYAGGGAFPIGTVFEIWGVRS
jgi:hypothetical protein